MRNNNYISAPTGHFAWKALFVSILVTSLSLSARAQAVPTQTIRGTVTSAEDNQPIPGANIYLKSLSSLGTFSDANGEFRFPSQLKAGDVLVFSFMGLKTTEYVVPDQLSGPIAISLPLDTIQIVDDILVEGNEPVRTTISSKRKNK